ncbi:MAG: beta-ketoacyl-[acyl-carrier-protein] synthase family protein [Bryobacteraceae bacterium]
MSRRVVVTGIGVVSAIGATRDSFWESLVQGRPGIGPLLAVDASQFRFPNGAEARCFDPTGHFEAKTLDLYDRFSQFVLVAAREAMADAGLEAIPAGLRNRTAIVTGTSIGGQGTQDVGFVDIYRLGRPRSHPMTIPRVMPNAGASALSLELGVTGPVFTTSTACASSNHAMAQALWMVRSGMVDMAVTGGSEAPFSFGFLKAWESMRVVSPDTCRPFSADRKGLILGEGGAIFILEPLEAAQARGARIYAEFAGAGMSADAHHMTQPSVEGPVLAMNAALRDASLKPERIGYVNAHGTGTLANDATETRAIRTVFEAHAANLAVSSTKSMHGHALGAAGALEAAATILALRNSVIPPTANFTTADPQCDLDVVPNQARPAPIEHAISNAFAFGGLNAVLAFSRLD